MVKLLGTPQEIISLRIIAKKAEATDETRIDTDEFDLCFIGVNLWLVHPPELRGSGRSFSAQCLTAFNENCFAQMLGYFEHYRFAISDPPEFQIRSTSMEASREREAIE